MSTEIGFITTSLIWNQIKIPWFVNEFVDRPRRFVQLFPIFLIIRFDYAQGFPQCRFSCCDYIILVTSQQVYTLELWKELS